MGRKKKTEHRQARQFGLVLPVILGLLSALAYWREHPLLAIGLLSAAPLVLVVAFGLPALWLKFFRGWMALAQALSWVMTRVILSVFFFLVLTPFGLVMRVLGKTPLDLKWKDGKPTYWIDKDPAELTLERYGKQY